MLRWIRRILRALIVTLAVACAVFWLVMIYPRRDPHPALRLAQGSLAIQHARIYASPTDPPIDDGTVLIRDGRIAAVGRDLALPAGTAVLDCNHCVLTAGFWNAHVHFTQPRWAGAQWKPAAQLNAQLADMFLSRGFTTVVDLGSNMADTIDLRRRIERGELDGPFIYTAGSGIYPPHGIPYYLRATMPRWIQWLMPQPRTPQQARAVVLRSFRAGADVTKLFTGSWVERGRVLPMPLPIAAAAVQAAHENGRLVFAHPSNQAGSQVAIDSGVDVLAHAPDDTEGIGPSLFAAMRARNMAMTPTLKMFATTVSRSPRYLDPIYAEVRTFHDLGGMLLFGTDVGYMTDYSTEDEFQALAKCGLSWQDMLAMLTTNPSARFGVAAEKGTVAPGKLADLTLLDADPAADPANFARVRAVLRSGRVVWKR